MGDSSESGKALTCCWDPPVVPFPTASLQLHMTILLLEAVLLLLEHVSSRFPWNVRSLESIQPTCLLNE